MGFSIDYGFGWFGAIIVVVLISAGAIAFTLFLTAANRARKTVVEDDPDAPKH